MRTNTGEDAIIHQFRMANLFRIASAFLNRLLPHEPLHTLVKARLIIVRLKIARGFFELVELATPVTRHRLDFLAKGRLRRSASQ